MQLVEEPTKEWTSAVASKDKILAQKIPVPRQHQGRLIELQGPRANSTCGPMVIRFFCVEILENIIYVVKNRYKKDIA
jgi:hypothetical protein